MGELYLKRTFVKCLGTIQILNINFKPTDWISHMIHKYAWLELKHWFRRAASSNHSMNFGPRMPKNPSGVPPPGWWFGVTHIGRLPLITG